MWRNQQWLAVVGAISLSLVYRIAHVAARRVAVLTMLFRISPRIVTSQLRRNEERSATLLSHCSPLCCPTSLRCILPQHFRSECRLDARRRRRENLFFLHENDATICISQRFQCTKPVFFRPRHVRRCNVGKQVYTIFIMQRVMWFKISSNRVAVTYNTSVHIRVQQYFHYLNDGAY